MITSPPASSSSPVTSLRFPVDLSRERGDRDDDEWEKAKPNDPKGTEKGKAYSRVLIRSGP